VGVLFSSGGHRGGGVTANEVSETPTPRWPPDCLQQIKNPPPLNVAEGELSPAATYSPVARAAHALRALLAHSHLIAGGPSGPRSLKGNRWFPFNIFLPSYVKIGFWGKTVFFPKPLF